MCLVLTVVSIVMLGSLGVGTSSSQTQVGRKLEILRSASKLAVAELNFFPLLLFEIVWGKRTLLNFINLPVKVSKGCMTIKIYSLVNGRLSFEACLDRTL